MTTLCTDAGYNFEDLERGIWIQRNIIFPRLVEWLDTKTAGKYRKSVLDFLSTYFSITYSKHSADDRRDLFLCQVWKESKQTYGVSLCQKLLGLLDDSIAVEERTSVLHCLNYLYQLSPSAKAFGLENNVIKKLLRIIRDFGLTSIDSNTLQTSRKVSQPSTCVGF